MNRYIVTKSYEYEVEVDAENVQKAIEYSYAIDHCEWVCVDDTRPVAHLVYQNIDGGE